MRSSCTTEHQCSMTWTERTSCLAKLPSLFYWNTAAMRWCRYKTWNNNSIRRPCFWEKIEIGTGDKTSRFKQRKTALQYSRNQANKLLDKEKKSIFLFSRVIQRKTTLYNIWFYLNQSKWFWLDQNTYKKKKQIMRFNGIEVIVFLVKN